MFPLKTKDAFTAHLQRPNDVQANASAFSARWQFNNDMSVSYELGFVNENVLPKYKVS